MKRDDSSHSGHEHRILVFGVGGCGVNILRCMKAPRGDKLRSYALDTDAQSFQAAPELECIHLETQSTQGMSTAGDVDVGRQAVFEHRDALSDLCALADMVFIVAGFGGGTGTGGAAALAELASDAGALIISFVTMPFGFEGLSRQKTALDGLHLMVEIADGVVVVHNDRLSEILEKDDCVEDAFDEISRMVAGSIEAMWRLIVTPGVINLDFADVRRMVVESHGLCCMVCAEGAGDDGATEVVERILDHPLFDSRKVLNESHAVIVGITGGSDLRLSDVQFVMSEVKALLNSGTRLVMGTAIDSAYEGRISVVVLSAERLLPNEESLSGEASGDGKADLLDIQSVSGSKKTKKAKPIQTQLSLVSSPGKGRFRDVEPTLRDGEDIDVPTFVRRGIKLSS